MNAKKILPADDFDDDDEGSVTRIIRRMQGGDAEGADFLWARFYARLTYLARNRLGMQRKSLADEEDVALESLSELFRGLLEGKYAGLENRDSFWRLLVTVACRNVADEVNKENRQKRGGGQVFRETEFDGPDNVAFFDNIASNAPSPDVQVMITERCAQLLESLDDGQLQAIAVMKTAGSSNKEVGDALGLSLRTVERKLSEIRDRWSSA